MVVNTSDLLERMETDNYLDEDGKTVMTEKFLVMRGFCCGLGCRHCPYTPEHQAGNKDVTPELRRALIRMKPAE